MKDKIDLIFLGIIGVFLILIAFSFTSPRFSISPFAEQVEWMNFCEKQGYDFYISGFSERFGKIKCFSCYGPKCIMEEFNVTKDWRGILHLTNKTTHNPPCVKSGGDEEK